MRRPSLFKKRDVTRAVLAILAAGLGVTRIEFTKEGFVVFPGKLPEALSERRTNEWDEVLHAKAPEVY